MELFFCPLASSSEGNAVYLRAGNTSVLFDAGISAKRIITALRAINMPPPDAVFITHEHSDHIKGAGVLSRKFGIPVFATPGTWLACDRSKLVGDIEVSNRRHIYTDESLIVGDLTINAFPIPHDASQPVGYAAFYKAKKVAVCTDMGHITDTIIENIADSDIMLIESNHDVDMLVNGSYPEHLKRRILGKNGHLSNVSCGMLLSEVLSKRLKHIYLGHLSEENNSPEAAFDTVAAILENNHPELFAALTLRIAARSQASVSVTE